MNGAGEGQHRLLVPDVAKAMIIIGILGTHLVISPYMDTFHGSIDLPLPMLLLYIFLMGFLVISGYFYRPRGFQYNVKRRLMRLAVVFVACTFIVPLLMYGYFCIRAVAIEPAGFTMDFWYGYTSCLKNLIGGHNVLEPFDSVNHLPTSIFYTCMGYYFINLVIVSSIVFYAVADRALSSTRSVVSYIFAMLALTAIICTVTPIRLPFQIELVPISVAFMIFGAYLGRRRFVEDMEAASLKNRRFWIVFLCSLLSTCLILMIFPTGGDFSSAYFGKYGGLSAFPFFVAGCIATIVLLSLSMVLSRIPYLSGFLSFIGKHTLSVLLLHLLIGKSIGYLFTDVVGYNGCACLDVVEGTFVVLATLIIAATIGKLANDWILPRLSAFKSE